MVCGAPNARTGMKGVFGPAGITRAADRHDAEESTIRGVASRGMLMSAYELALSDDHEGIIELPAGRAGRRALRRLCSGSATR